MTSLDFSPRDAKAGPSLTHPAPPYPTTSIPAPAPRPPAGGPPGGGIRPPGGGPALADVVSAAVNILGLVMLVFVITVGLLGQVRHSRDQTVAYDDLREQLATAVAAVGQTDGDGNLTPMGSPIGLIEIPQIDVSEVLFEGTTSEVTMSGPGHRRDSPFPGQVGTCVVFGRQSAFGHPFRDLDQLQPGQVITITTAQGKSAYRISALRRAGDPQPKALTGNQGRLTLTTATGTPFMPTGALRVDADLVTPPFDAGPRPIGAGALPTSELAMQGDSNAWLRIMLFCQLLVACALLLAWARHRWGYWQAWTVGLPVVLAVTVALSTNVSALLPNLL